MSGKWSLKAREAGRFDATIGHRCPHADCKVAILHTHDKQGRLVRDSIDWESLDSLSDPEMKRAVGGDIAGFLQGLIG